jgi:hypothetical protein
LGTRSCFELVPKLLLGNKKLLRKAGALQASVFPSGAWEQEAVSIAERI